MYNLFFLLLFVFSGCRQKGTPPSNNHVPTSSQNRSKLNELEKRIELPDRNKDLDHLDMIRDLERQGRRTNPTNNNQPETDRTQKPDLPSIMDRIGFSHKKENVEFLSMFHDNTLPECPERDGHIGSTQEIKKIIIDRFKVLYICVDNGDAVIFYDRDAASIGSGSYKNVYRAIKYNKTGATQEYLLIENKKTDIKTWNTSILLEAGLANRIYRTEFYAALIGGEIFIFQQKLGNIELSDYIENNIKKSFYKKNVPGLVLGVLQSYKTMQKAGYYHRDIKPKNIIMIDDFRSHFIDFDTATSKAQEKLSVYTQAYLAPEVAQDGFSYKFGSLSIDLFSLGVTLLHIMKGSAILDETNGHSVRGLRDTSIYFKHYCTNDTRYSIDNKILLHITCELLSNTAERVRFWNQDMDELLRRLSQERP